MTDWNPEDKALIDNAFKDLLNSIEYKTDKDDVDLIKRAFRLANDAHNGIRRKTGEPYITHPIEVAQIVATEIGLGPTSIATALMHDVVEDSDYTLDDIESMFGKNIAKLIDGLTRRPRSVRSRAKHRSLVCSARASTGSTPVCHSA